MPRGIAVAVLSATHTESATDSENENRRCTLAQIRLDNLLRRVQGEFLEMPGLRLTAAQAQRLWGLTKPECESVMYKLVDSQFLRRTRDGAFVLFDANSPAPDKPTRRTERVTSTTVAA